LFLPGVQAIQALAAGNAVVIKPAPGGSEVMAFFRDLVVQCGIPRDLIQILDTSIDSARQAIELGVDKVVLTGSAATGRTVAQQLADALTPAVMELGGCDAVFVLPQANLERVVRCLDYALRLNGGATCIAPRRIFVTSKHYDSLVSQLVTRLRDAVTRDFPVASSAALQLSKLVEQAVSNGAVIECGEVIRAGSEVRVLPFVLSGVRVEMDIARADLFAPIVSIVRVNDMAEAIELDRECPYKLGAAIFGPQNYAEHWAGEFQAGCVVINDLIVPTADPRVSFGGREQSGWGQTRGAEGLLEMTYPKTICTRKGNWLPHLDEQLAADGELLSHMLDLFHQRSWRKRLAALRAIMAERKKPK
jgi:acyl-CoA reductase-like NAD-dependent aldehyde dehydrogenase